MKRWLVFALIAAFPLPSALPAADDGPQERHLGEVIDLKQQLTLTVTREPQADGTVDADAGQRRIERGVEFRLTFASQGSEPVQGVFLAVMQTPERSNIVLLRPDGKRSVPRAIRHLGGSIGYRTVETPGGFAISGECLDNAPVGLKDQSGKHWGLVCLFCVEPGKKDEILVMFDRKDVLPGSKLQITECSACPAGVTTVHADPPAPPAAAPSTTAPSRLEGAALSAGGDAELCTVLARANALFGLAADWGASREEIMHAWGIEPFTLRKGKRSLSAATLEDGSLVVSVDGAAGVTKRCNRKTGKWE